MADYKSHEDFFAAMHDQVIYPTQHGENFFSCTIEQLYQFFKQRYDAEKAQEALENAANQSKT